MSDEQPAASGGTNPLANLPHGVLFKRAMTWDVTEVEPTAEERAALPAGTSERTAAYLAWRRGMLYLGLAAGAVTAVFALIGMIGDMSGASEYQQGSGVMSLLALLLFASKIILIAIVFMCLTRWTDAAWTGRRLRLGWAIALLTPLGIALIPISAIVLGEQQRGAKDLFGLLAGTLMFISAVPALLSLFPGMLRASMTVKTVFPGRGSGPLAGAALIPIYVIFLIVVVAPVQQIVSSFLFFVGVGLFVAGPLLYARHAVPLLRPLSPEAASEGVRRVRLGMRWFQVPGLFLMAVALLSKQVFGAHVFGFDEKSLFGFWKLIDFVSSFVLMVSTYTVVSADGLIQAMAAGEARGHEDRATEAWLADSDPLEEVADLLGPLRFLSPKSDEPAEAATDDAQ